mmetsp:Transcript_169/g.458  ORF Transcript_169/g.458 Transcript_169/m.458 type:complete len:84 (-) Transcript_169:61-312(-)
MVCYEAFATRSTPPRARRDDAFRLIRCRAHKRAPCAGTRAARAPQEALTARRALCADAIRAPKNVFLLSRSPHDSTARSPRGG